MDEEGSVFRKSLNDAYDHLGVALATNALWLMASLGAVLVGTSLGALGRVWGREAVFGVLGGALGVVLIVGPLSMGLFGVAEAMSRREEPSLALFFRHSAGRFWAGAKWAAANIAAIAALLFVAWFWFRMGGAAGRVISIVWAWVLIAWIFAQLYAGPLMSLSEMGLFACERNALLLMLAFPGPTIVLLAQVLPLFGVAIAAPLVAGPAGLGLSVLVSGSVLFILAALFQVNTLRALVRRLEEGMRESEKQQARTEEEQ